MGVGSVVIKLVRDESVDNDSIERMQYSKGRVEASAWARYFNLRFIKQAKYIKKEASFFNQLFMLLIIYVKRHRESKL